jgi:hypothetical protein
MRPVVPPAGTPFLGYLGCVVVQASALRFGEAAPYAERFVNAQGIASTLL